MKQSDIEIVKNHSTLKNWIQNSNISEENKTTLNEAIRDLTHLKISNNKLQSEINRLKAASNEMDNLNEILKGIYRKDKYLVFKEDKSKKLKTKVFDVYNIFGENLGHIRWDFVYQSYAYHAGGVLDPGCLFEAIVKMIELNRDRKNQK